MADEQAIQDAASEAVAAESSPEIDAPAFLPTFCFRWFRPKVPAGGALPPAILQQLYMDIDGNQEWRALPVIAEV